MDEKGSTVNEEQNAQTGDPVTQTRDVVIVGAGPVGLTLALALGRAGVRVDVLEREPGLPDEGRATTIHASTLELLDELGVAAEALERGIPARTLQYRDHSSGEQATFDFGVLAPLTQFPFRLQLEQNQLCGILRREIEELPNVALRFACEVTGVTDLGDRVEVAHRDRGVERMIAGRYVVGADGARSLVRRQAGIDFEGSTYPFTMLTLSTYAELDRIVSGIAPVTYVFDSERAMAFLRIKDHWRISLNTLAEMPEDRGELTEAIIAMASAGLGYDFDRARDVKSVNIHRIHQRVAATFASGRLVLAGDAAHLNSPTGGMGMNSGIHDACELTPYLLRGLGGEHSAELFAPYSAERRRVAIDVVGFASDQSTKDMIGSAAARRDRIAELQRISRDPAAARTYLRGSTLLDDAPRREVLRDASHTLI